MAFGKTIRKNLTPILIALLIITVANIIFMSSGSPEPDEIFISLFIGTCLALLASIQWLINPGKYLAFPVLSILFTTFTILTASREIFGVEIFTKEISAISAVMIAVSITLIVKRKSFTQVNY